MVRRRFGRTLSALAITAMAAVPMALGAFTAPAGAAGSVTVGTAAQLNSAWVDGTNTTITLTANITISDGDCVDGAFRSAGSGITVDGQGLYGITSSCFIGRILVDSTSEAVTLTGLTHFDGGSECGPGGGISANGPVTAINSSFANNSSTGFCPCGTSDVVGACAAGTPGGVHAAGPGYQGGAIYSADDVVITNSTFTGNHADYDGGAVFSETNATVTGSTFTGNSAGMSGELETYLSGGALAAPGTITVDGSTFDGNWIGDAEGNLCSVCGPSGGAIANGSLNSSAAVASSPSVTITSSTFTDNHADCDHYCLSAGGAIESNGVVTTSGSTFSGNHVNIADCAGSGEASCYAIGGAVLSVVLTDTGSTFSDNHADAAGCADGICWNEGGAIATEDLDLTGTTVADNSAACDSNCASYGGGVLAGTVGPGAGAAAAAASSWAGTGVRADIIIEQGSATITQSTFSGNVSSCETTNCGVSGGGALFLDPASVDISASTFSGNSAQYAGGFGVFTDGAPVTLTNSTVTGNSSSFEGAVGLTGADASLAYDTIVGNTVVAPPPDPILSSASSGGPAWGGAHAAASEAPVVANVSGSSVTVFGTIVALPQGADNCDIGSTTSQGYNWSDDSSCGFTDATDKVATPNDPGLNALGAWGGPTDTMLPLTPKNGGVTSPVIDAIPAAACQTGIAAGISTDQRGVNRPQLVGCDIGAVEVTQDDYQVEALVVTPRFTG